MVNIVLNIHEKEFLTLTFRL